MEVAGEVALVLLKVDFGYAVADDGFGGIARSSVGHKACGDADLSGILEHKILVCIGKSWR